MRKILFIISVSFVTTIFAQEASFESLGFIDDTPNSFSEAHGVSEDGSIVTGVSFSFINGTTAVAQAFRWENGEMTGIGMIPISSQNVVPWSFARAISGDGSTIVGYGSSDFSFSAGWEAMKWTQNGGMEALGDFLPFDYWSESTDVSGDGSIIVGRSFLTGLAFRWENGILENLSTDDVHFLEAWGISYDGTVIAGNGIMQEQQQGMIWKDGVGFIGLGSPVSGTSQALNISANGKYVVGDIYNSGVSNSAFIWTEEDGMLELGTLGGFTAQALDVSNDGIVVGFSQLQGDPDYYAFIWTEENGMKKLQDFLEDTYGLVLPGWKLSVATSITSDGKTIVGYGINPDGKNEAWRIFLGEPIGGECMPPESLSIETVTGTTAQFSWNNATGETNGYNWYVMNIGDFPESGNAIDSGTTDPGVNFATATGLTPNTVYFVFIQTNCSEDIQSDYGIFMILTSNLDAHDYEKELTLFPNPTTGIINLKTQDKINSVSVYNSVGQKVSFNSLNKENSSIDISNLSSGIYFVEVFLNDKSVKRYKIIKK